MYIAHQLCLQNKIPGIAQTTHEILSQFSII